MKNIELGKIAKVFNGKTPSNSEKRSEGIPVLKIKNISSTGEFSFFDSWVNHEFEQKHKGKKIKRGDTLFLNAAHSSTHVGSKNYFVKSQLDGVLATGEWLIIRPNKEVINEKYLNLYITSNFGAFQIRNLVKGIHLYPKDVQRIKIPLPPLKVQKKIAEVLDKADAIRQRNRLILQKYDQLTQSVFLDMFKFNTGKKVCLVDVVNIQNGQVDPTEAPYSGMLHIGGANIEGDTGNLADLRTAKEELLVSGKYLFTKEHVLYSKIRPYLNKVCIPGFDGLCSADIYPIKPKSNLTKEFLLFLLKSDPFIKYANKHSGRANIPKINRKDLLKFEFKLPDIKSQKEFSNIIEQISSKIKSQNQELQKSEELFQSLLQRAFKGELVAQQQEKMKV